MRSPVTAVRTLLVLALAGTAAAPAGAGDRSVPSPGRNPTVHCPWMSLRAALRRAAEQFPAGPLTVTIHGVCVEAIDLGRDDTTLRGGSPGAGLQAPSPASILLTLRARRTTLQQLTFTGGSEGIRATDGATFTATGLRIVATTHIGVLVEKNSTGELAASTVEDSGGGVEAREGGVLRMVGGAVDTAAVNGVQARNGGHVALYDGAAVRGTGHEAVHAPVGGSILLSHATVEDCDAGVLAISGGNVAIQDATIIQRNRRFGVAANDNGTVLLGDGVVAHSLGHGVVLRSGAHIGMGSVVIEHNGNDGVSIGGGSTATFAGGTIVRNNAGNGIALSATSAATFFDDTAQVIGNTGTAVVCFPGSVAQIVGAPGTIEGNGRNTVECPRSFP